jgi:hypothetical protein
MKKLILATLTIALQLGTASTSVAGSVDISACKRPTTAERLFSNKQQIFEKCVNDAYDQAKERTTQAANKLHEKLEKLQNYSDAKGWSKKYSGIARCPTSGSEVQPCKKTIEEINNLIGNIDTLMGWDLQFSQKAPVSQTSVEPVDDSPKFKCPPNIGEIRLPAGASLPLKMAMIDCMVSN